MEKVFAIVNNNLIENVIVCEQEFADAIQGNQFVVRIDQISPTPQIGWTYDGSTFTPPVEE